MKNFKASKGIALGQRSVRDYFNQNDYPHHGSKEKNNIRK